MLSLRKPSPETLRRFIHEQAQLPFSYAAVGATANTPPNDHVVDRTRVKLGEGEAKLAGAIRALRTWEEFQLGWVEAWSRETPIEVGAAVAVMGRAMGCWWLNACRIVYVVDEPGRKFGFAYGTLPCHVESGEERFLVEFDPTDGGVWYDIIAFSRPNHFLTRLGYPMVRRMQKRFGRDSAAAMLRAVEAA